MIEAAEADQDVRAVVARLMNEDPEVVTKQRQLALEAARIRNAEKLATIAVKTPSLGRKKQTASGTVRSSHRAAGASARANLVNILYVGPNEGTAGNGSRRCSRLGHEVLMIDPFDAVSPSRYARSWVFHTGAFGYERQSGLCHGSHRWIECSLFVSGELLGRPSISCWSIPVS